MSIASTLHHLRTTETDPRDRDLLDAKLDAIMAVIERREPHVPTSIDQQLDKSATLSHLGCEELHQRMLDIFEAAVDRLASARPGGAS